MNFAFYGFELAQQIQGFEKVFVRKVLIERMPLRSYHSSSDILGTAQFNSLMQRATLKRILTHMYTEVKEYNVVGELIILFYLKSQTKTPLIQIKILL